MERAIFIPKQELENSIQPLSGGETIYSLEDELKKMRRSLAFKLGILEANKKRYAEHRRTSSDKERGLYLKDRVLKIEQDLMDLREQIAELERKKQNLK
jgi:Mg2+ and Co2+ transporter CorA